MESRAKRLRLVQLPFELERALYDTAARRRPKEACGVLLGRTGDEVIRVSEVREGKNLAAEDGDDLYELDPGDFVRAQSDAERLGLDVVGLWHSHPKGPAQPSERDRATSWPGWTYVIVSGEEADIRAWQARAEGFSEQRIERVRSTGASGSKEASREG